MRFILILFVMVLAPAAHAQSFDFSVTCQAIKDPQIRQACQQGTRSIQQQQREQQQRDRAAQQEDLRHHRQIEMERSRAEIERQRQVRANEYKNQRSLTTQEIASPPAQAQNSPPILPVLPAQPVGVIEAPRPSTSAFVKKDVSQNSFKNNIPYIVSLMISIGLYSLTMKKINAGIKQVIWGNALAPIILFLVIFAVVFFIYSNAKALAPQLYLISFVVFLHVVRAYQRKMRIWNASVAAAANIKDPLDSRKLWHEKQMNNLENASLKPKKPNREETDVYYAADNVIRRYNKQNKTKWRVETQVSMNSVIDGADWRPYASKSIDVLIRNNYGEPVLAIEHHGGGHYGFTENEKQETLMRDAEKKKALERASIPLLITKKSPVDKKEVEKMIEEKLNIA